MFESKYSKFLTILLIVIIVAILGLVGYLGFNYYKNYTIKHDAEEGASSDFIVQEQTGGVVNNKENTEKSEDSISESIASANLTSGNGGMKTYKGFEMIGSIEIPKTDTTYPVLQAPPIAQKLEVAVAAVYPEVAELNTEGNVVISGHNYRNGLFFSNNKNLEEGDKIYITDASGNKVTYSVYKTFLTDKNDVSFYNRDTDGAKEITLTTCADDNTTQRVIVLARAEE